MYKMVSHVMRIPEADWKNQPEKKRDMLFVAVSAVLLVASLVLWWTTAVTAFLGITAALVIGGALYFSAAWQPVLYIVMALLLAVVIMFLLIEGAWQHPSALFLIGLTVIVIVFAIYLSYVEELVGAEEAQS